MSIIWDKKTNFDYYFESLQLSNVSFICVAFFLY